MKHHESKTKIIKKKKSTPNHKEIQEFGTPVKRLSLELILKLNETLFYLAVMMIDQSCLVQPICAKEILAKFYEH